VHPTQTTSDIISVSKKEWDELKELVASIHADIAEMKNNVIPAVKQLSEGGIMGLLRRG